jgi:8-oxo-dGTP diphosphatase
MTTVVVSAAVIEQDGRFLVTRRQKGVHLEGYWEFPGGKCEAGETIGACVAREIEEELGVAVQVNREILTTSHRYPDRVVELHFLECRLAGDPRPQVGQEMQWIARADLARLQFPPADEELIALLSGQSEDTHAFRDGRTADR